MTVSISLPSSSFLGYRLYGRGPTCILVLHDFFSDTTSYDGLLSYLNPEQYTLCLADLRGYGRSAELKGFFTLEEIATDVIAVADFLNWPTFHLLGHSMSGQHIQYIGLHYPARILSLAAISPVPPCGSPRPVELTQRIQAAACGDISITKELLSWITAGRVGSGFVDFKAHHWYACSTQAARLAYLDLFAQSNFSLELGKSEIPFLVMVGEYDQSYSAELMQSLLLPHYLNAQLKVISGATHYANQEAPPYVTGLCEQFWCSVKI